MKRISKKVIVLLFAFCVLLIYKCCSVAADESLFIGDWYIDSVEMEEQKYSFEELAPKMETDPAFTVIHFDNDGTYKIDLGSDDDIKGIWKEENGRVYLTIDNEDTVFSITGEMLKWSMPQENLVCYYTRESPEAEALEYIQSLEADIDIDDLKIIPPKDYRKLKEEFSILTDQEQKEISDFMERAIPIYNCTDISQPVLTKQIDTIIGDTMAPLTKRMKAYGFEHEKSEYFVKIWAVSFQISAIMLNSSVSYSDSEGIYLTIDESDWNIFGEKLQDAIDYYYDI